MSDYFLDASVLVKRYTVEPGSTWLVSVTDLPAHAILVAEITLAEVAAGLASKQRAHGGIRIEERDRALSRFLQDCDERFLLLPVDRYVIELAVELTQRHRLRGYDAVQLATALVANRDLIEARHPPLIFVASDTDLLAAAQMEGLPTENPVDHRAAEED